MGGRGSKGVKEGGAKYASFLTADAVAKEVAKMNMANELGWSSPKEEGNFSGFTQIRHVAAALAKDGFDQPSPMGVLDKLSKGPNTLSWHDNYDLSKSGMVQGINKWLKSVNTFNPTKAQLRLVKQGKDWMVIAGGKSYGVAMSEQ